MKLILKGKIGTVEKIIIGLMAFYGKNTKLKEIM